MNILEVDGVPDSLLYRKKKYHFVPSSLRGSIEDLVPLYSGSKWSGKYKGKPLIVRTYDQRGRGYPYSYALYAQLA